MKLILIATKQPESSEVLKSLVKDMKKTMV